MKIFSHYMLFIAVLCISLFFACTSNIELPLSPDEKFGVPSSGSVLHYWCVSEDLRQCQEPVDDHCPDDSWNLVSNCRFNSSSSSNTGSSSSNNVGPNSSSSSDEVSSSSSSIDLGLTGDFEFRNFDYSKNGNRIYWLNTGNMHSSTTGAGGNGKLYNTLKITNAVAANCDTAITIEATIGSTIINIPFVTPPATSQVTVPGELTAHAVATCDGKKDTLRTTTATVVSDPTLTDCPAQILPSTYVAKTKKEYVKGLISLRDNYERCNDVIYAPGNNADSLNFAALPAGPQTPSLNITASVQCTGGVTVTHKNCPVSGVVVADNYFKFDHEGGTKESISNGTTVIEVLDGYDKIQGGVIIGKAPVTRLGCELNPAGSGELSIKINGGATITNYWVEATLPAYATNGNRILLEKITPSPAVCIVMF